YADCMSLYGDWANLALLERHLRELGNEVCIERASFGETPDFAGADFLFLGAGTERTAQKVLVDFCRRRETICSLANEGLPMLFSGTSFPFLGRNITDAGGAVTEGLALADFTTVETTRRITGDIYGGCPFLDAPVVGFLNKCSLISGIETPFLESASLGFGNETEHGPEGFHWKNVLATHITGPLLVKNPALLTLTLGAIYARRGLTLPEELPRYPHEQDGYELTASELRRRFD
ncbi:MAG: hypothetical protein RRZ93_06030, partial [Ruthenibacterium sp.]